MVNITNPNDNAMPVARCIIDRIMVIGQRYIVRWGDNGLERLTMIKFHSIIQKIFAFNQKSMHRPFFSQSPYLEGSNPLLPPISLFVRVLFFGRPSRSILNLLFFNDTRSSFFSLITIV